jgi:hypothetical protein
MTRWINPIGLVAGFLFFFTSAIQAQDLYDVEHTRIYARHLYEDGKYAWAADEYSRLIKIKSNDSFEILFLKANRLSGQPERAVSLTKRTLKDPIYWSTPVLEEYVKLMLWAGEFQAVDSIRDSMMYVYMKIHQRYTFQELLLKQEWDAASGFFSIKKLADPEPQDTQYSMLLQRTVNLPHRNPALAATMSALVPGSGKVYCGEWKDAIISFLFVTFSAYESAHAFKTAGAGSIMGYIYGGMAIGFYGGGVYGSYKSANRFNTRQNEEILEDAKAIIFSTY